MKIQTKAQYVELAKALMSKGYTPETVYEPLAKANYCVKIGGGPTFDGIYIARLIAVMHELSTVNEDGPKPLEI